MKFIVTYFYRDSVEIIDYIERPTMAAAAEYARSKAEENFREAANFYWDNVPPFVLNDKLESEIDQKMVREAAENYLSFSVKEFDENNEEDLMIMWACSDN